jgi:hypothetical protein
VVDDAPLTVGATSLNSAALANAPVIDATRHLAIVVDPDGLEGAPEVVWVTAHSVAGTVATVLRGMEGSAASQHSQGVPWVHAVTALDLARPFARATRTAGDVTLTTSYADVDTALDLVLPARAGDVVEYGVSGSWDNGGDYGRVDVATVVSGAVVNTFSGIASGWPAWLGQANVWSSLAGSAVYAVVSGDLSGGAVTLRLRARRDGAGVGGKVLSGSATAPLIVWAKNLGAYAS